MYMLTFALEVPVILLRLILALILAMIALAVERPLNPSR